MKLTAQVKLLPTPMQASALRETMKVTNSAANRLSQLAWDSKEFRRFLLQKSNYRALRDAFPLSAQMVCLLTSKVANAYKRNKKVQCVFRALGSIAYDLRVLALKPAESKVSIWTIGGREQIPFACGESHRKLLALHHCESDLIYRDKKWFLNVTVEVPEEREREATGWIGCDLGISNILTDSDGENYSGAHLNAIRHRHSRLRAKLQGKRTKAAKRLLAKRRRAESRFARDVNHRISKRVVAKAERTGRGIALEDLSGIRSRIRASRPQRRQRHSWAFFDLREKITYKAKRVGVPVRLIDPRNTSRKCSQCGHVEKANRRTRDLFRCLSCGHSAPADSNASENIRAAAVILPNIGTRYHGVLTNSGLSPGSMTPSLFTHRCLNDSK